MVVIAGTFRVLSHYTRVQIIQTYAVDEFCLCELFKILGLSALERLTNST
jgi:hypothetical protein